MAASPVGLIGVVMVLLSLSTTSLCVEYDELESMLNVLRARGYNLFSNAISTSDVKYDVASGKSFTFFAPTDVSLFTLDMKAPAADYVSTLRCHVISRRFPFPELRREARVSSSLKTLAKSHRAKVRLENSVDSVASTGDVITVDGVPVIWPDLFYSRHIAVHGLGGFLNCVSFEGLARENQASSPSTLGDLSSSEVETFINAPLPEIMSDSLQQEPESPEATSEKGVFLPSHLPEEPQVSPAYDLWPESGPAASSFIDPSSEPGPPPEFSENDDPMVFPPSATEFQGVDPSQTPSYEPESSFTDEDEKSRMTVEDEREGEFFGHIPAAVTTEEM